MNYPVWQLGYPGGLLIALIAVLHVFVSHFAVGGGAFLVVSEHLAYKRNDSGLLDYAKRHAKFFALVTLVFGAVTGVGNMVHDCARESRGDIVSHSHVRVGVGD